jgi:alkyl hydroperoxide reductase subunit AhpC
MSIANAMMVRRAAMKERSEANRAIVICDESENRRAIKVTPAAIGGNASILRSRPGGEQRYADWMHS